MSKYLLLLLAAGTLSAQTLSFGVKVGAALTDPDGNVRTSVPYAVGPSVEVRLSGGFAIEGSAILHHFRSTSVGQFTSILTGANTISTGTSTILTGTNIIGIGTSTPDSQTASTRLRGNSWEFPVLVKRYFRMRTNRWEPYVGAGAAVRTIGYRYDGTIQAIHRRGVDHNSVHGRNAVGPGSRRGFRGGRSDTTRAGRSAAGGPIHPLGRPPERLNKEDVGVNLGFRF